jgi:hypothetical protein
MEIESEGKGSEVRNGCQEHMTGDDDRAAVPRCETRYA